ncbi:AAA family ATPase [Candidatus Dependentiae bacterium]|nr:AAA family ATPase [Candidatus Dependentiae bacterium]
MGLKMLPLSLLFALSTGISTYGQLTEPAVQTTTQDPKFLEALLQRVLKQLATTDKALEELAQSVNNNSIKVDDKKAIRDYVTSLRSFILEVRQGKQFELSHATIPLILDVNKSILEQVNSSLVNGLKQIPTLKTQEFVNRSYQATPLKASMVKRALDHNEAELKNIAKNYAFVGSTPLNRFTKRTTQIANEWNLPTIAKRALPYIGLGAYYVLITPPNKLPDYPEPTVTTRTPLPDIINTKGEREKHTLEITKDNPIKTISPIGNFFQNLKNLIGSLPKKEIESRPKLPVGIPLAQGASSTSSRSLEQIGEDLVIIGAQIGNQTTVQTHTTSNGSGLIGNMINPLGRFINVDTSKPFYTITPAAIFAPIIMKDAKELAGWASTQTMKSIAYLKGESFDTGSPVKSSRSTFNDVIGLSQAKAELGKIASYFKHKASLDRTGAAIERGYLLVGPVDAGKALAHALAGEITKELKAQGKTDKCGIYDIHASALLKKELGDVIKEADKATPAIVVINELDWLTHQEIDAKVWGDIVTTMTGAIKNPKKPVIIIATAQDAQALTNALGSSAQLGVTITFGQPSDEDRAVFFTRELANYGVSKAEFNIAELARQTSGSSLTTLGAVVKHALNRAHIAQRTLTHDDIEQSINTLVYGISAQHRSPLALEKQVLAAHYAGKIVAHNTLDMPEQLVKATILPVTTKTGIRQGALFTYAPDHRALTTTQQDKEKAVIIELAGLAAQEVLLGSVSHAVAQETKQKVFAQLKEIVFEGINEQDMPKELKNTKLAQIWHLMEEYTQRAKNSLHENKEILEKVAKQLETEQTISVYYNN